MFEIVHLVPEPALAKHVAMVGCDDEDGVVDLADLLDGLHDLPDLAVEIGGVGVIAAPRPADVSRARGDSACPDAVQNAPGKRVRRHRQRLFIGKVDLLAFIQVPEFRAGHIGVMRLHEAGDEGERTAAICGTVAGEFHQLAPRRKGHLLVKFDLQSRRRVTRLEHRVHVMVPAVDPFIGMFPVGHPGEIGGIDVGRGALLKAVKLVRPDKMHASGKAGAIARAPQIMRKSRHRRAEIAGVVIGGDAADQLARHEAGP